MSTLLVKHIHTLVTMDDERRELTDAAMLIRGPAIERIASSDELEPFTAQLEIARCDLTFSLKSDGRT